ncbi:MAG: ABC transporter ATP-binding protein [Candidatus Latescibacterota bacterium]|nr:MAG: ABC transporter ATP-binding protein [Candidatus Latescibacterota bacterium]
MNPAIEWRGVSKSFGSLRALVDLDLAVRPGEVFGFLGPNGAGKTTAIRIAAGLARADAGVALLGGIPSTIPASRARAGYVPEDLRFPQGLRLEEWARLQLDLRCADASRLPAAAERTGLAGRMDGELASFSKGMRRRAALLLLLALDPEIWLLDEPTADLDIAGRELMENVLLDAKGRGKAIFLSSHILSEVERVCDRVGVIGKGRLEKTARPADLLPAPFLIDAILAALPPEPASLLGGRAHVVTREPSRLRVFVADREEGNEVVRALEAAGFAPRETVFRAASLRDALGEVSR